MAQYQYYVKSQCKVCNTIQFDYPEKPGNKFMKIEKPIKCDQCEMDGKDSNCKIIEEFERKIDGKIITDKKL